ncbi:MAG: DUF523 domain-containing protein [Porticoccus sp.]|nr:DUF523 domain-containing protein [Porticoccus sp.]
MSDLSAIHLTKQRNKQPKVGISACLVGNKVRYDGGDKYHQLINKELSPWLDLQVICPEVEAALGIPRPPIHLVDDQGGTRALGIEHKDLDVTDRLETAAQQLTKSQPQDLCAYIVKSRSPSCGAGSTPSYDLTNKQVGTGDGLFVRALKTAHPNIVVIEESSLSDTQRCKEFLEQCYLLSEL